MSLNFSHRGSVLHSFFLGHSSALQERQATGARSPSADRSISPTVYSDGFLVSLYPPPLPCTPSTKPLFTSDGIICSIYFFEISCLETTSFIGIYPSSLCSARSIITLSAYLPLVEIILTPFFKKSRSPAKKDGGRFIFISQKVRLKDICRLYREEAQRLSCPRSPCAEQARR